MNCAHCEDRLVDLVYGELSSQEETLVRSHADECVDCKAALSDLQEAFSLAEQFTFDEPSASFDQAIMEAARSHALREEKLVADLAPTPTQDEDTGLWTWIRSWMTGPQYAAAAAMVAIVAVGIWSMRQQMNQPLATNASTPEPVAPLEKFEAERAVAAKPGLDREADDSLLGDEFSDSEQETAKASAQLKTAELKRLDSMASGGTRSNLAKKSMKSRPRRRARAARSKGKSGPLDGLGVADDRGGYTPPPQQLGEGYAAAKRPAPKPTQTTSRRMPRSEEAEAPAAVSSSAGPSKTATVSEADKDASRGGAYRRGINHYEGRRYGDAAREFEDALSEKDARRSDALIYLARSYRQRGDCARAVKPYAAFLRENPKDTRVSGAKKELNDCRARLSSKAGKAKRSRSAPAGAAEPAGEQSTY